LFFLSSFFSLLSLSLSLFSLFSSLFSFLIFSFFSDYLLIFNLMKEHHSSISLLTYSIFKPAVHQFPS
jgi:hypothetical protein